MLPFSKFVHKLINAPLFEKCSQIQKMFAFCQNLFMIVKFCSEFNKMFIFCKDLFSNSKYVPVFSFSQKFKTFFAFSKNLSLFIKTDRNFKKCSCFSIFVHNFKIVPFFRFDYIFKKVLNFF